jgi:glutathione S-transferase
MLKNYNWNHKNEALRSSHISNCQRTRIVLYEKTLPYETIPVDLAKKEQKKPEFLKMNPNGKVPVLVDGDTILYESCIINEYLEEKYPNPPLLPKDRAQRAKIRIQVDFGVNLSIL